ncbi:hypothetical protein POVWA2_023530 [Plasmodium ovale wallikeri]|uniref:Uncharacterized protein n=1 Tax=Plasmodium ovale wallikeri TaxID=864142 RepID=A0A1A8YU13_PLAOA|nr:hypothetical protein POVWA1_023730 [Plasmodium ovale wallikeri]SBT35144.1 hypothetical protein POVWA2_023530 [Plasmodium ovale wallikeri]
MTTRKSSFTFESRGYSKCDFCKGRVSEVDIYNGGMSIPVLAFLHLEIYPLLQMSLNSRRDVHRKISCSVGISLPIPQTTSSTFPFCLS